MISDRSLKKISQKEFEKIYNNHQLWLTNEAEGERADLSYTDLSRIDFEKFKPFINLRKADLHGADLRDANLYRADLYGSDISCADLRGVSLLSACLRKGNLYNSNLRGADLSEADLSEAYLGGVDLHTTNLKHANLFETYISHRNRSNNLIRQGVNLNYIKFIDENESNLDKFEKESLHRIQESILNLTQELELIDKNIITNNISIQHLKKTLEENVLYDNLKKNHIKDTITSKEIENSELEQVKKEKVKIIESLQQTIKEKTVELEQRGYDIEKGLNSAFEELSKADDEIKPEIDKLNGLFLGFTFLAILLFLILAAIWAIAFHDLHGQEIQISRIWIYTAPSLIIVGFIWASILQINRAQRLLISIRNDNKKYKIIKLALEGYYKVENKLNKTPIKAQETFSAIMDFEMEKKYDASTEEEKLRRESKKDQIPAKELLDQVIDYVEKLK